MQFFMKWKYMLSIHLMSNVIDQSMWNLCHLFTTFWKYFLQNRNEKMTEDQSVSKKRNISYDHRGGETLVCSDSEEDSKKHKEKQVKRNFSHGEDKFIR